MKAAIYLRVAVDEHWGSNALDTQRQALRAWVLADNVEIVKEYCDAGVSGIAPLDKRPALRQLLIDAEQGQFSSVLVYNLDRMARSMSLLVEAMTRLKAAGVNLISRQEQLDTASPRGIEVMEMLAGLRSSGLR